MPPDRDDNNRKTSTTEPEPDYEGGARKYPPAPPDGSDAFDQRAADNRRRVPYGLTEPLDETQERTSRSENVDLHLASGKASEPAAGKMPRRRRPERK
jgi:hypothetical protein